MSYSEFCKEFKPTNRELYLEFFEIFKNDFQVKNPRLAVTKLEIILNSAFKLVHNQSFANMSMRSLSKEAQLSIGGLYAYFTKKEQLAQSIHKFLNQYCRKVLNQVLQNSGSDLLEDSIRAHIYVSEYMQPWFFFAFMESKNLNKNQRVFAAGSELMIEDQFTKIIAKGQQSNKYNTSLPPESYAAMIKPLLHDWYLKRGKYKARKISVDNYANQVMLFVNNGLKNE